MTMERLTTALADKYPIEREFGGGGVSQGFVATEWHPLAPENRDDIDFVIIF